MAVITISRQVAALGDEIGIEAEKALGYQFVRKEDLEDRIVKLGFPSEKLPKYDEKKPGFFASLVKDRDEYLQHLQTAVLEAASRNNCILIGRGTHIILEKIPSLISFRLIAPLDIRLQRLMNEFNWSEKQAKARIDESDANRRGFDKSFFDVDIDDATHFHIVMNTGILNAQEGGAIIANLVKNAITKEKDAAGIEKIKTMLTAQRLVNTLIFEHKIAIEFLRAVISNNTITLQGIADSGAVVERAIALSAKIMPNYTIQSAISIVQDFKAYQ